MHHARTPRYLTAIAACLMLAALLAVPAGAARTRQSATPLSATLEACAANADHYALFKGTMPTIGQAGRMEMRFELSGQPPTGGWQRLSGITSFDEWDLSDTGVSGFIVKKRVAALLPGWRYRTLVRYRWRNAAGRIVRRAKRLTPVCKQPDTRPDLAPGDAVISGARRGAATISVFVRNKGVGPATAFSVKLTVGGVAQPLQHVDALAAGARTPVRFALPECPAGAVLELTVDSDAQIAEQREDNNVLRRSCPSAG